MAPQAIPAHCGRIVLNYALQFIWQLSIVCLSQGTSCRGSATWLRVVVRPAGKLTGKLHWCHAMSSSWAMLTNELTRGPHSA
jgi:hypothetical protein